MKIRFTPACQGNVLVACLFTMAAISAVMVAYLRLGVTNEVLVARSQVWNIALPAAEAGLEEALTHINYLQRKKLDNLDQNGWVKQGNKYSRTRTLSPDSYYSVSLDPLGSGRIKISATGYVQAPLSTNYVARTIEALARKTNVVFIKALIAKKHIRCGKGTLIDSYDSTDNKYSTGGKYDVAKRLDTADVAATSDKKNAVKVDKTKVYGEGATPPKGNFEFKNGGAVGDKAWIASGNTGAQPGKLSNDFSYDFPAVNLPGANWVPAVGGQYNKVDYKYILSSGYWQISHNKLDKPMIVTSGSKAVVYITTDFKAEKDIIIENGASLVLYMGGKKFEVADKFVTLNNGNVTDFQYYGLDQNKEIKIKKKGTMTGIIYAPRARIMIEGAADYNGSVVGKCVHFKHDGQFHYDEGVNTLGTEVDLYAVVSWSEY